MTDPKPAANPNLSKTAITPDPQSSAPDPKAVEAAKAAEAAKIAEGTIEPPTIPGTEVDVPACMKAIEHRVPAERMPDVQQLIVEGASHAMQILAQKAAPIAGWRKKVDALGPQLASEVRGMVRAIADQECRKRTASLLGQLDAL